MGSSFIHLIRTDSNVFFLLHMEVNSSGRGELYPTCWKTSCVVVFLYPTGQTTFSDSSSLATQHQQVLFSVFIYLAHLCLLGFLAHCFAPSHVKKCTLNLFLHSSWTVQWDEPASHLFSISPFLVGRNSIPCPCEQTRSPILCTHILNVLNPWVTATPKESRLKGKYLQMSS